MQVNNSYAFNYKGETRVAEIIEIKSDVVRARLLPGDKSHARGYGCFTLSQCSDVRQLNT